MPSFDSVREQSVLPEQRGQRETAEATGTGGEEIAAGLGEAFEGGHAGHSRLMNSSRFMSTRARATKVAASIASCGGVADCDDAEDLQRLRATGLHAGFLLRVKGAQPLRVPRRAVRG